MGFFSKLALDTIPGVATAFVGRLFGSKPKGPQPFKSNFGDAGQALLFGTLIDLLRKKIPNSINNTIANSRDLQKAEGRFSPGFLSSPGNLTNLGSPINRTDPIGDFSRQFGLQETVINGRPFLTSPFVPGEQPVGFKKPGTNEITRESSSDSGRTDFTPLFAFPESAFQNFLANRKPLPRQQIRSGFQRF